MKRIVLCFDGTWNTMREDGLEPDGPHPTNVVRFYNSVRPRGDDGVDQVAEYVPGVGTGRWDRLSGGVLGAGLVDNIREGYRRLAETYVEGDEIFVVGFSRGAYTARSLVGMIRNSGLVDGRFGELKRAAAYALYRTRGDVPETLRARLFRRRFSREVRIRFLGVWDTVGALGIPLALADKLDPALFGFHDTELSSIVDRAYHALAIDEHRGDYAPTLWSPAEKPGQHVEQRWFIGAHSDVGGSYPDRSLSDIALRWMQDRASEAGLGLDKVDPRPDAYNGTLTDSYAEFAARLRDLGEAFTLLKPRLLRRMLDTRGNETVDPSVDLRRRDAELAYSPQNRDLPPLA